MSRKSKEERIMPGEPGVAGATDSALPFPESRAVQRQRPDDLFLSSGQVTAGSKRLFGVTQTGLARSLVHVRPACLACLHARPRVIVDSDLERVFAFVSCLFFCLFA